MSSLYQRTRSSKYQWTAYYRGEKLRKSTGESDSEEAKKVQSVWDQQLRNNDLSFYGFKHAAPSSVDEYFEDYLSLIKNRKSLNTYIITRGTLNRFQEFLHSVKIIKLDEINPRILNRYISNQLDNGKTAKTVKNHVNIISIMFKHAIIDELIEKNPAKRVILPKVKKSIRHRLLEPRDLKLIFENNSKWQLYYEFLYFTGLRAGDVAMLNYGHLDFEKRVINAYIRKSDKYLTLPIADILFDKLDYNKKSSEPIFPELYHENYVTMNWRYSKPRKYLQELLANNNRPKATLHSFRVTFNNILRDTGVRIEDRQVLLGHAACLVTKEYTRPNQQKAAELVNKIPDFSNVKESGVSYGVYYNLEYNYEYK